MLFKSNSLSVIAFTLLFPVCALAAPIYKWTDSQGITHYSSRPTNPAASQADLPKIMRAEVQIPKVKLESCKSHGGINCKAGADSDGSVICYDGFKGAAGRFRFSCNSPKLEITNVSDLTPEGNFSVFVRNSKSVKAEKASVLYKAENGQRVKLIGPENIDAFGVAEFTFEPKDVDSPRKAVTIAQLDVLCANCPG